MWLAVLLADGTFERAGLSFDLQEERTIISVVGQAAEILAAEQAEDGGKLLWLYGCIPPTTSILLLPVAITVAWERSPGWIPIFLITELLGMFLYGGAYFALGRLFPRRPRPISLYPSQRYPHASEPNANPEPRGRLPRTSITVGFFGLCIASLIYPFSIAFPGPPAALAVGLLLGPGSLAAVLLVAAFVAAFHGLFSAVVGLFRSLVSARPVKPSAWATVVCSLLDALFRLRVDGDYRSRDGSREPSRDWAQGPVWTLRSRNWVASPLQRAASSVVRSGFHGGKRPSHDTSRRIAAWLRDRENEILTPSPAAPAEVEVKLARGFASVCLDRMGSC